MIFYTWEFGTFELAFTETDFFFVWVGANLHQLYHPQPEPSSGMAPLAPESTAGCTRVPSASSWPPASPRWRRTARRRCRDGAGQCFFHGASPPKMAFFYIMCSYMIICVYIYIFLIFRRKMVMKHEIWRGVPIFQKKLDDRLPESAEEHVTLVLL